MTDASRCMTIPSASIGHRDVLKCYHMFVFLVDVFAAGPAEMSMVGIWMLNAWAIYIVEFFYLLSGTAGFSSSDDVEV
jgi:hypothetical protein